MGYASKLGRARINARNPRAAACCDRCGFIYNLINLSWQYDFAGASLINKRILVCDTCNDVPQSQLRNIILPADPVPVQNARIQAYKMAEVNERTTSGQDTVDFWTGIPVPGNDVRITQDDDVRVVQQTGEPPNGLNEQPGTDTNAPGNNTAGVPYDNTTVPETGPL